MGRSCRRLVIRAFFDGANVDHALVKPGASWQVASVSGLDLDIIYGSLIVFYIYVKTDALSIICSRVHGVLWFDVNDLTDFDLEDGFQKRPAQLFLPHDRAEHEVIHDREFLDGLGQIDIPPRTFIINQNHGGCKQNICERRGLGGGRNVLRPVGTCYRIVKPFRRLCVKI